MSAPTRYNVGDKVVITEACLERMRSSNRSCVHPGYPSDSFLKQVAEYVGCPGEVTHTFPPGYEVTARFYREGTNWAFHMKDNWIERIEE